MKRGDIYYADLRPVVGSEQGGVRPVLIIQNDIGNRYSPTVICAAITSRMNKTKLPTHIEIFSGEYEIEKDSVILLEQLRTSMPSGCAGDEPRKLCLEGQPFAGYIKKPYKADVFLTFSSQNAMIKN